MFDVAFRHQQALDPSALTTIPTTIHAIEKAIEDCRHAGLDANSDPAVVLLARHLASICATRPADTVLRGTCADRIAALRRFPPLLALAVRGVAYDAVAKERFHIDGRKALRRLAAALDLPDRGYDLYSLPGEVSVAGEIVLRTPTIHLELTIGRLREGRELLYRRAGTTRDPAGPRNHYAAMREVVHPDRLAARIRRDLDLAAVPALPALLSA
ncbi:hypothetical protein ACVOMT_24510 (plasmid) [Sphingomonas panni]|jgi:hypothetical protein